MSSLAIDVVRGVDGFQALRRDWEALFDAQPSASPFMATEA